MANFRPFPSSRSSPSPFKAFCFPLILIDFERTGSRALHVFSSIAGRRRRVGDKWMGTKWEFDSLIKRGDDRYICCVWRLEFLGFRWIMRWIMGIVQFFRGWVIRVSVGESLGLDDKWYFFLLFFFFNRYFTIFQQPSSWDLYYRFISSFYAEAKKFRNLSKYHLCFFFLPFLLS